MRLPILVTSLLFIYVGAIFEDQVGKFDWRKELVGCPSEVVFDRLDGKSDRLIVSTEQSVVASLTLDAGKIAWRRIMDVSSYSLPGVTFVNDREHLYTVTNDGRSVRIWRRSDGVMTKQIVISDRTSERHALHVQGGTLFVSSGTRLVSFSSNSDKELSSKMLSPEITLSSFNSWKNKAVHVSANSGSTKLRITLINENGEFAESEDLDFTVYDSTRCHAQHSYVTCFQNRTLVTADVFNSKTIKVDVDFDIENVIGLNDIMAVRGKSKLVFFKISSQEYQQKMVLDIDSIEKIGLVENQELIALVSHDFIRIVSLEKSKVVVETHLPESVRAYPKAIFASSASKSSSEFEIVIVGQDCRVEMISVSTKTKRVNLEWAREESLINAASVEMVDLPLSESQQMIEDEFEEEGGNIISAFARRIQVQIGQFCRFTTRNLAKALYVFTSFSQHGNGLSDFISSVRSVSSSSVEHTLFERDYFNLRKVIIVASTDGTIVGLDSSDGKIIWKIWLGSDFSPLKSEPEGNRMPLFVQRTTAHYQLHGLASVAFSSMYTRDGVILSFDPMVGKIVSRTNLGHQIKRISLLPVTDQKHVHPIVTIGRKNEVVVTPSISRDQYGSCSSLYLMEIDRSSNIINGLKVDLPEKQVNVVWSSTLGLGGTDRILSVKGKPYNQKVHSQGRVLVSREVQYKYVNPNLVAIASFDEVAQHLSILLVDIVTGQLVHSASVGKAAEPIHLVNSENWIAYTYWSEKGRRTELGIMELYEGADDLTQKEPPTILAQSYIYAQGVDAMTISETEQGLTTRSILLALPNGNIHEVSRRLLDATRPLEVTQAMREEMIIGYMPEIAVGTEEMINYNQTVHRVRGIKASPSGLESTSLVFAYGSDLFFTRLVPSGTFDILKDDFDHVLISIVLTGLLLGSYVTKRWARSNALTAQWC